MSADKDDDAGKPDWRDRVGKAIRVAPRVIIIIPIAFAVSVGGCALAYLTGTKYQAPVVAVIGGIAVGVALWIALRGVK